MILIIRVIELQSSELFKSPWIQQKEAEAHSLGFDRKRKRRETSFLDVLSFLQTVKRK
jgi:hypothetical protein